MQSQCTVPAPVGAQVTEASKLNGVGLIVLHDVGLGRIVIEQMGTVRSLNGQNLAGLRHGGVSDLDRDNFGKTRNIFAPKQRGTVAQQGDERNHFVFRVKQVVFLEEQISEFYAVAGVVAFPVGIQTQITEFLVIDDGIVLFRLEYVAYGFALIIL